MLDYFQKKLMTKLFKKYKKTYFVAILVVFCPNLGKNEFSWKKVSIIYICEKSEKKTIVPFLRKIMN